jgi:hypothetical protein
MPDMPRTALITLLTGAIFSADAHGQRLDQENQHLALSGLTAVQARITVQWDMAVTMRGGTTLSEFENDLRSAFERGLGGTGISVDETAPAHVDCVVSLTYLESAEGTVTLVRTVRLFSPDDPDEPLGRWAVAWSRGETRVTGRDALSGSEVGGDCAAAFGQDWRRANPRN